MGGGRASSDGDEEESSVENDSVQQSSQHADLQSVHQMIANRDHRELLKSYDDPRAYGEGLDVLRSKVMSYMPGAWIEMADDTKLLDYNVPMTTTLLVVGPRGSGKSSLVNKISRMFQDDKFAPDRAQVSHNTSTGDGTYFLKEHIISRGSKSFCLYDTRSFDNDLADNTEMIKHWMTKGVSDGEPVIRKSDGSSVRTNVENKARHNECNPSKIRMVNFVIYVVNGVSVLNSMDTNELAGEQYNKLVASTFNCPYLSFNDDKPAVVVTHGDLLSISERARVRAHLGELLNIPPVKQTFDVPDGSSPSNDLKILDMLRYSLEHSDRNFSRRPRRWGKVVRMNCNWLKDFTLSTWLCIFLLTILGIIVCKPHLHGAHMDLQSEHHLHRARMDHQSEPHLHRARMGHQSEPPLHRARMEHQSEPRLHRARRSRRPQSKLQIKWHEIRHIW